MIERTCANHPDRRAIGVCVITQKAICGECSTRYEGVNYSKEGLEILKARRAGAERSGGAGGRVAAAFALLASPVLLGLMALFYYLTFAVLIDLQQLRITGL